MINCLVIDDEPLARELLAGYIAKIPELNLVGKGANALEAFDILHQKRTDLVFLDIEMPAVSGINFISSLKNPPAFIFVTAFPEHAVMSYELNAVDYLLKPVTFDRFQLSISKFLNPNKSAIIIPDYSYFKVNGKMIKLVHRDIQFAQSFKDYIVIQTIQGKYITHMTMKYLTGLLPKELFKRVHRSFLIGITHIKSISRSVIEIGNTQIPIGESYKEEILRLNKPL